MKVVIWPDILMRYCAGRKALTWANILMCY